jgi:hypothetical protein
MQTRLLNTYVRGIIVYRAVGEVNADAACSARDTRDRKPRLSHENSAPKKNIPHVHVPHAFEAIEISRPLRTRQTQNPTRGGACGLTWCARRDCRFPSVDATRSRQLALSKIVTAMDGSNAGAAGVIASLLQFCRTRARTTVRFGSSQSRWARQTKTPTRSGGFSLTWCARRDSNSRPSGSKPDALSN